MGQLYGPSLDRRTNDTDEYPMPPCTKVDPDVFTAYRSQKRAKQICMSCPIRRACRIAVMHQVVDPGGVYAALTKADRDSIRSRVTCPPEA
jgi:hypothetical protein